MERLVEGIQDAEKIRILRKEFAENGEVAKLKKLNQTVSGFMPEKLNGQNASQMVRNGRKLLSTFLNSLIENEGGCKVYTVCGNSIDGIILLLAQAVRRSANCLNPVMD